MIAPFNPRRVTGSFTGTVAGRPFSVQLIGFAKGQFIKCTFDEARVTKHMGGQGDAAFVMNASTASKVQFSLLQGADANEELSKLIPDAKRNYLPVGTLSFKDLNGTTLFHSDEAVIEVVPDAGFGDDLVNRDWGFTCGDSDINVGAAEEF